MPRFAPFAGLRYDVARVDLSAVIAPPYDVIGPDERARLAKRHSANAVRVELPEPDHREGLDRYDAAAAQLERWQSEGLVRADGRPSLYLYRMTSPEGRATNGVIGALGIDDESAAGILPHEQTLPKAKSDRFDLLRATRANLSPIWGLSLAEGLGALLIAEGSPDAGATDDDGVIHELWVIDDPERTSAIGRFVERAPVVVADGHHRYETARLYRSFVAEHGSPPEDIVGTDLIMAFVVELAEGQLEVGPIHRGLSGLPDGLDLVDSFSSWFDMTKAGPFDARTVGALGDSQALALVMPSGIWLLAPRDGTPEAAGSTLDSAMVALVLAELPEHELAFYNRWEEGVRAVESEEAQAVVLLRPGSVDQIAEWAHAGRRMPPKTTYFHPKPRTGMVFRTLDDLP